MVTIKVNDKYRFRYDNLSFMPEYFQEGGEVIPSGKYKGKVTVDRWVSYNKYFSNINHMFNFLANESIINQHEELDLQEFLNEYERIKIELHVDFERNKN